MSRSPRDALFWENKAREYQTALEAKTYLLVTRKSRIHRTAIVRWMAVSGEARQPYEERQSSVRGRQVAAFVRNLRRNTVRELRIHRIWTVVEDAIHDELTVQTWEKLVMAQAHRDGRNFHYAKWLMSKDMDQVTNDLTGGMKPRR